MTNYPKLIVIGLDGATFDIIQPMVGRGELPTFARLMAEGAGGVLMSTIPPVSPQAWSSFLTGVHPGRHGVFGFLGKPQGRFYRRPIRTSRDIMVPTLFHIAGEAGRRVAAFGVPMTYPPSPINGVVVPEQLGLPHSYPSHVWDDLVAAVGDPRDPATHIRYIFTQDKRGYVARQEELLEIQRRAVHWLLDREAFDLFAVVFHVSDRLAHYVWKYMDTNHPDHRTEWAEMLGDALPGLYRQLDTIIGELWERLGPDGTLVVMSDHGFGPLYKHVFLNKWLCKRGWLAVRPLSYRLASLRYPWPLLRVFNAAARKMRLPHLALPIGRWQKPIDPRLYDPRFYFDANLLIDWSRTQVYSGNSDEQGLYINVRGREPCGVVSPGSKYEILRHTLRQALMSVTDPEDEQPVVERVWFREEIYNGPYLEYAPDLVIQSRNHRYMPLTSFFSPDVVRPSLHLSGTHRPDGICLFAGPPIRTGVSIKGASIVDLAPTALYLLGVPVPKHMEGRVLKEALTSEWQDTHPIHRTSFTVGTGPKHTSDLTDEEEAAAEAHLRGLGYIG